MFTIVNFFKEDKAEVTTEKQEVFESKKIDSPDPVRTFEIAYYLLN